MSYYKYGMKLILSLLVIFGLGNGALAEGNKKDCHYHKGIETITIPCNKTIIKPELFTEMELWVLELSNKLDEIMEESIVNNKCKTAMAGGLIWLQNGWSRDEINKRNKTIETIKKECDL